MPIDKIIFKSIKYLSFTICFNYSLYKHLLRNSMSGNRGCTLNLKHVLPMMYLKSTKIAHMGISSLSNRQCSFESRNPIQKSDDFDRNQSEIRVDQAYIRINFRFLLYCKCMILLLDVDNLTY